MLGAGPASPGEADFHSQLLPGLWLGQPVDDVVQRRNMRRLHDSGEISQKPNQSRNGYGQAMAERHDSVLLIYYYILLLRLLRLLLLLHLVPQIRSQMKLRNENLYQIVLLGRHNSDRDM